MDQEMTNKLLGAFVKPAPMAPTHCGHHGAFEEGLEPNAYPAENDPYDEKQQRFIVDRDITEALVDGIFRTIQDAINACQPIQYKTGKRTKIKIASNLYEESLKINVPGITLEPKEKGGEVTLQSDQSPCIEIDVGHGNTVTINNSQILLKNPEPQNRSVSTTPNNSASKKVRYMDFDGSEKGTRVKFEGPQQIAINSQGTAFEMKDHEAMKDFSNNNPHEIICIILVKTGILVLNGCSLSVESLSDQALLSKGCCIYQMPDSTIFINKCSFRGGGLNKAKTAGIYNQKANSLIQKSQFHQFQCGGVVSDLTKTNIFVLRDNAFVSCHTVGVYVQGDGSVPIILHNVFMVCKCPSIIINTNVEGFIAMNEMQISYLGVEIINNKSIVFENTICKSHEDGIRVICNSDKLSACPLIQKNYIEASTQNGIVCRGPRCWPDIKANVIESNRKSGIKLVEYARAHIGGQSSEDNARFGNKQAQDADEEVEINLDNFQAHTKLYEELFEKELGEDQDGENALLLENEMMCFYETLNAAADFKEKVMMHITDSSEKMGNLINQNYSQGIILEEGCAADIFANIITKNAKANIALGGNLSGNTKIKFNTIEEGKQEGIFVVEGGTDLQIAVNDIQKNGYHGIILVHSDGNIQNNNIQQNEKSGLYLISETYATIDNNQIEENKQCGIDIKDPSLPELKKNRIEKNQFQIRIEKTNQNAKKKVDNWLFGNTITGENDIPQGFNCQIF